MGRRQRSRRILSVGLLVAGLGFVAVFTGPIAGIAGAHPAIPPKIGPQAGCDNLNLSTPICHVYIIYLENQNIFYVLNHGPFQHYLANKYSIAAQYYSLGHFSYKNYAAATSGRQLLTPHLVSVSNVVDLIRAKTPTPTWASYDEDMPFPCDWNSTLTYKATHNPLVWYSSVRNPHSRCITHDFNFTSWNTSLNASQTANNTNLVPNYAFFGPNATHSCWLRGFGVSQCDAWLHSWLTPLVNDSFFNRTVFFITYDEGAFNSTQGANGTIGGGHVYFVAVSPYACPGFKSYYNYTPYNLLTTTEWLLGLGRLGNNDSWQTHQPMRDLFCFPLVWSPLRGPSPAPSAFEPIAVPAGARRTGEPN